MESTPGSTAVDSGSKQHAARRSRRCWVMVLALVGFGAGALAPAAGLAGGDEAIPMPAMHLLYSLRAAHSTRECGSHPRLCALIAAHARTGIGPFAWKRTDASQAVISEAEASGMQDAIAANYAVTRAQGRTPRTRRPDEG